MKKLTSFIGAFLLLLLSTFASSAQKNTQSLLWKVTGNGLQHPSYLFGTIHMICEEDFALKPKVQNAFKEAQNLVLEIDLTDSSQMTNMMAMMISSTPLSKDLSETEKAKLDSMLLKKIGMPLSLVDYMNPAAVYILLSAAPAKSKCQEIKSYEFELMDMAKESSKTIGGLETVKEQMDMLNKIFTAKELIAVLESKEQESDDLDALIAAYKKEDLIALHKIINNSSSMDAKSQEILLINRNKSWAEHMPNMMQKGTQFFAVGAGHLSGAQGVIQLLKNAGYTVSPVMDK